MPSAYSISEIQEREIQAVIEAGYYTNKSEVVRDALRTLFHNKPQMRLAASVEMYRRGRYALSKCAEIAGVTLEEFKEILADRGIKARPPEESGDDIRNGVESLRKRKK